MSFNKKENFSWNSLTTTSTFDRGPDTYAVANTTRVAGGNEYIFSPTNVSTPISVLIQSLIQHLCNMLEKDVDRAKNLYKSICERLYQLKLIDESYDMGEFEVIRHQYQRALYQLVEIANDRDKSVVCNWPLGRESPLAWSRCHQDFEDFVSIGRGGFGNVFRAKHKLDNIEYAVKKICIRSSDIQSVFNNHLSEVKTFASLNHPNIVSYKAAWLEPLIEPTNLINLKDKSENIMNRSSNGSSETEDSSYLSRDCEYESNESDSICFEEKENSVKNPDTRIVGCKAVCKVKNSIDDNQIIPHANLQWAVLFIQMELCQTTLKCWLDERNAIMSKYKIYDTPEHFGNEILDFSNSDSYEANVDQIRHAHVPTVFEIVTQLTQAIEYIHQRGIIHHDIKPSNIFINKDTNRVNVQLADFGLACPLQQCHKGSAKGTELYAAPEQLNGKCDSKSDIYSLGIVFLELLAIFSTAMEKCKVIEQSTNGDIPENITANFPVLTDYIRNLIQKDPNQRMSATELLGLLKKLKDNKECTITDLRRKLLAKDLEIAAKDEEINRLKNKLASVHT